MHELSGFINHYTIDPIKCTISFYNDDNLLIGVIEYVKGIFDYSTLDGVPTIYFDSEPSDAPEGSYSLYISNETVDVAKFRVNNEWRTIFDASLLTFPLIVDDAFNQTGYEPFLMNGIKVYNANGLGIENIDKIDFSDSMSSATIDIVGFNIIKIFKNEDDNYVVTDDGKLYSVIHEKDVMGNYNGYQLQYIYQSQNLVNSSSVAYLAGYIAYIDAGYIKFEKVSNNITMQSMLSLNGKTVVSIRASYSLLYIYLSDGNRISIKGLDVLTAEESQYTLDDAVFRYDENGIIGAWIDAYNRITLKYKINDNETTFEPSRKIIDMYIDNTYNVITLSIDGVIESYDVRKDKSVDVRRLTSNSVFDPPDTRCDNGYCKVLTNRVSYALENEILKQNEITMLEEIGTAYGINATAGFAVCEQLDVMVQVEKGFDKYMSIVDIHVNGIFSYTNPYKLVKLKYNGAVGVAIWGGFIWVAFSDRKVTKHDMYGVLLDTFFLDGLLNATIQDISSNCDDGICQGLYFMTTIGTVYRFDDKINLVSSVTRAFQMETFTDRTSFAPRVTDNIMASSTAVSEEKIRGFLPNGIRDPLYIMNNDKIIHIATMGNKLYTLDVHYPYSLEVFEI